ncbi:hypothetical protein JCGZ_00773 [Jatropha curcas]|uniref:Uncharacterized protein n=2 Tax=Jatropha curcas TaxID=180498 RepID=A0A067KS15_JATCU|nr:hypothetical protein JCGZ_00773 [Jatropha curcas]
MHQLFGSLPQHRLRDLSKKYGPVMHIKLGQVSNIVVSSPEAAKQVMKTHDIIFLQRPFLLAAEILMYNFKDIAFAPYGDSWRQMRKICTLELLSTKRVRSFRPIREDEVSTFIRTISSSSKVNLGRMVFALSNTITLRSAFGKVSERKEAFLPLVQKIVQVLEGFSVADVFPSVRFLHRITGMRGKLEKLHQETDIMLENIINEHRENKRLGRSNSEGKEDDLVDVLLNIQDSDNLEFPLTMEHIKAVMLDMFLGGTETSAATIEWAMAEMVKDPRVLEKAQKEVRQVFNHKENIIDETRLDELKYLKLVIKETLRLHPPVPLLVPRQSLDAVEIDGYKLPINTKVIINAWALGRDSRHWNEAEKFYPERFQNNSIDFKGNDFQFIPFGAGRRMCPGVGYGMALVELALANLLYHFDWKLPNGLEPHLLDMSDSFGASARRKHELHLIPIPYNSSPSPVK